MTIAIEEYVKVPRADLIEQLYARDGDMCQYPGEQHKLNPDGVDSEEVTLDHHIPQAYCKVNGWTMEEIWALSNLRLMCKKHNAKKGDRVPNEDGTLPAKVVTRTFRYRRQKRANRPEACGSCMAGRNLGPDEWCNACGSGPNPGRYPKWRQMGVKECDHDLFYCVSCTIWFPEQRRSALDALLTGGDGYE